MKVEERDEIVQYLIRIRENIKYFELKTLDIDMEIVKIREKIDSEKNELDEQKNKLLDLVEQYKMILINTPVEMEKERNPGIMKRLFGGK